MTLVLLLFFFLSFILCAGISMSLELVVVADSYEWLLMVIDGY
jgi:hypothetical protein